jgi:phospholipase A1
MPEMYVVVPMGDDSDFFRALRFGFLHQSNGRDDPISRSWNRVYLGGFFQLGRLIVNPRIWYRIPEDSASDDNPDIQDYMGRGDLNLVWPHKHHQFRAMLRNNFHRHGNRGAMQLEWTYPLSSVYIYVRYFDGYGESLIDYNHRVRRIGVGFAVSR